MALTIVTPATNKRLCRLPDVKAELGLTDATQDVLLDRYIDEASDIIQKCIRKVLAKQTYDETVAGYGSNILMLSNTPIVSVTSILINGSPVTDYSVEDAYAGLLYRKVGWEWTAAIGWDIGSFYRPDSEEPLFTVRYVAGFVVPEEASSDLPLVYQRCAIDTVKDWYLKRSHDPAVLSEKVGDLSVTYNEAAAEKGLPLHVLCRLQGDKRYF